ncbi:MAG: hypothetical protein Q9211_007123 [Gyalolechia sp. 1 TL-2023]
MQPSARFFGAVAAGGIVGAILLLVVVGGLLKSVKGARLERDVEANPTVPESKATPAERAETRSGGSGGAAIRRATEADAEFVVVDLRDPVVRAGIVWHGRVG